MTTANPSFSFVAYYVVNRVADLREAVYQSTLIRMPSALSLLGETPYSLYAGFKVVADNNSVAYGFSTNRCGIRAISKWRVGVHMSI